MATGLFNLSAGMDMADMAWEVKCREEDMKQRALENERRAIDDARRCVDEKAQQLKALSHQAALIAGFSMIVLVEIQIPNDLNPGLLVTFGCTTASVVSLMLIAMLNGTYILVAILRYDCVKRETPFFDFWRKRCESDWQLALKAFGLGVPLFLCVLGIVGWVVFWEHESGRIYAAALVSSIALVTLMFWFAHTDRKWGHFLMSPEAKLHNPNAA